MTPAPPYCCITTGKVVLHLTKRPTAITTRVTQHIGINRIPQFVN
jgi:hypothetical protein